MGIVQSAITEVKNNMNTGRVSPEEKVENTDNEVDDIDDIPF